jgi:hypothetical protein
MSCIKLIYDIIQHNFVNSMQTLQIINDINILSTQTNVFLLQP